MAYSHLHRCLIFDINILYIYVVMREYLRLTLAVANLKPFWQALQQPGYHHTQQQLLYNSQAVYKLTRALLLGSSSNQLIEQLRSSVPVS